MFKLQTPATAKAKTISKEYVNSPVSQHLWDDFQKQVGSYARRSSVAKNTRANNGAGAAWYNQTPTTSNV